MEPVNLINPAHLNRAASGMPEGLRNGDKGEALNAIVEALTMIVDFDLTDLNDACNELEGLQ